MRCEQRSKYKYFAVYVKTEETGYLDFYVRSTKNAMSNSSRKMYEKYNMST
jgi:hypothetical protein